MDIERQLIRLALREDIGPGDITTAALSLTRKMGEAIVVAKAAGVISGIEPFKRLYRSLSRSISIRSLKGDGAEVVAGDIVLRLKGPLAAMLTGERTAMNILGHLSGVATMTRTLVGQVRDRTVKILDTRKTMLGMRFWEKRAVRHGGASNHRFGLYDMYMIKDNHIAAAGGMGRALDKVVRHKMRTGKKIEVEVKNLSELKLALSYNVDYILLDNFTLKMLKRAVDISSKIKPSVILEASGNISMKNIKRIASTGVHRISVGRITHSAPALDLSMKFLESN